MLRTIADMEADRKRESRSNPYRIKTYNKERGEVEKMLLQYKKAKLREIEQVQKSELDKNVSKRFNV